MPEDEDVARTVYLTGQPGSGKTELARQYSEQFKNEVSPNDTSKTLVITLSGKSEESLLKSVKEATRNLRLPVCMELPNPNHNNLMKELEDYFCGYSGTWLLIIDDMFEKNDFNNFFPRPGAKEWGGGQVLITTQDNNLVPACHPFAKKLSLNKGMSKEDALGLLKEISDFDVDDSAEEIIKELHYLPLALACCATSVGETRQDRASTQFGWKDYLDLYHKNAKLESRTFAHHNSVYPFSMTTATMIAVKRMTETSDVLRLAFSFLSYCAVLPVPLNVLVRHVKENLPVQNNNQLTTRENQSLSAVYYFYSYSRYWLRQTLLKFAGALSSRSLNMFERVLGADVSLYPVYYVFLAQSAIGKLGVNPTEARTQLDKALGYCIQNGDKYNLTWITSCKKHMFDNSTWWQSLFYWIRNSMRGRVLFASLINQLEDFSKERGSGKILYRRIRNRMNKEKALMVRYNYVILLLLFIFLFLFIYIFI